MSLHSKAAAKLEKELHGFLEDTEDLLEATRDLAGDGIDGIRKQARASLKSLRKGLDSVPGEIVDHLEDAGDAAAKAIRRKPLQWVGIAAGIGLVVGLLAMARPRD